MRWIAMLLMLIAWSGYGAMPASAARPSFAFAMATPLAAEHAAMAGKRHHHSDPSQSTGTETKAGGCPHGSGPLHCGFCPGCLATMPSAAVDDSMIVLSRYPLPDRGRPLMPVVLAPLLPPPRS